MNLPHTNRTHKHTHTHTHNNNNNNNNNNEHKHEHEPLLSSSHMQFQQQIERKLVRVNAHTYQRDAQKQIAQLQNLASDVCRLFEDLAEIVQVRRVCVFC